MIEQIFVDSIIPNARFNDLQFGNGIQCYEYNETIYVLVNTEISGLITPGVKNEMDKKLKSISKPVLYISMFKERAGFTQPDEIAWDSYVWFADAPKHFIHFEEKPKGIRPNNAKRN